MEQDCLLSNPAGALPLINCMAIGEFLLPFNFLICNMRPNGCICVLGLNELLFKALIISITISGFNTGILIPTEDKANSLFFFGTIFLLA